LYLSKSFHAGSGGSQPALRRIDRGIDQLHVRDVARTIRKDHTRGDTDHELRADTCGEQRILATDRRRPVDAQALRLSMLPLPIPAPGQPKNLSPRRSLRSRVHRRGFRRSRWLRPTPVSLVSHSFLPAQPPARASYRRGSNAAAFCVSPTSVRRRLTHPQDSQLPPRQPRLRPIHSLRDSKARRSPVHPPRASAYLAALAGTRYAHRPPGPSRAPSRQARSIPSREFSSITGPVFPGAQEEHLNLHTEATVAHASGCPTSRASARGLQSSCDPCFPNNTSQSPVLWPPQRCRRPAGGLRRFRHRRHAGAAL